MIMFMLAASPPTVAVFKL